MYTCRRVSARASVCDPGYGASELDRASEQLPDELVALIPVKGNPHSSSNPLSSTDASSAERAKDYINLLGRKDKREIECSDMYKR